VTQITFVNNLFPPHSHGGAENYVLRAATELRKRRCEVAVITTKPYDGQESLWPERTTYEDLDVYRFFPANTSHLSNGTGSNPISKAVWRGIETVNAQSGWAVKSVIEGVDPDIVHTNNLFGISTLAGRVAGAHDCKHVHTLHDYNLVCPRSTLLRDFTAPDDERVVCEDRPLACRLYGKQKGLTFGSPDVVTAPSQHVIDVHRKHGLFTETETERVFLGDDDVGDPPSPPEERSVLFVGKQLESKGLDTLLDAAESLPETTVHICGTGPFADHVERRAERIDTVYYHGYVSENELDQLRSEVAAAVVPSIWMENSPLTIYESFAAGVPVIGSDIGGIPELIEHGERGYLFDPKTPEDLAGCIDDLLSDPDTAAEMGRTALDWAADHTMEAHVDRLLSDVYHLEDAR
jgi:glycosyltransferase involved in cell wall biosynthesis